jgi:hypothetical protein
MLPSRFFHTFLSLNFPGHKSDNPRFREFHIIARFFHTF